MKVVIPTIPTLLVTLLSSSSTEAKDVIRRNTRTEEGSGEPEVADIINGKPTGKALPYQVGLSSGRGYNIQCGGSLISPRVVLIAAHCFFDDDGKPKKDEDILRTVWVNMYDTSNRDEPGQAPINLSYAEIGRDIIIHPRYNPATLENDVALVILPFGLAEGEHIKYAKLNDDPTVPAADERLYVSGWGDIDELETETVILLGTVVNSLPDDKCAAAYKDCCPEGPIDEKFVSDKMMCASKEGTDHCFGDSGGPLVIASKDEIAPANEPPLQVGIVSWAEGCARSDYPGVYTRVSTYVDWITSTACEAVGQLCSSSKSGKSSKSGSGKASKSSKSQLPSSVLAEEDVDNV